MTSTVSRPELGHMLAQRQCEGLGYADSLRTEEHDLNLELLWKQLPPQALPSPSNPTKSWECH